MASNLIQFECPKCLATVRATTEQAGQRTTCPDCIASLKVPDLVIGNEALGDLFIADSDVAPPAAPIEQKRVTSTPNLNKSEIVQIGDDLFSDLDVDSLKFQDDPEPKPTGTLPLDEDVVDPRESKRDVASRKRSKKPSETGVADEPVLLNSGDQALPRTGDLDQGDPFEFDDMAAIKIEGLTENITADDVFGVKCPVCDTRIHVHENQVGQQVACPICYSKVRIPSPPRKSETKPAWKAPEQKSTKSEALSRKELVKPIEREVPIDESYGLAPVEQDLLAPRIDSDDSPVASKSETRSVDDRQAVAGRGQRPVASGSPDRAGRPDSKRPSAAEPMVNESPVRRFDVSSEHEITTLAILKVWFKRLGTNTELTMRTALAVVFLALAYIMLDVVSAVIADPTTEFADKFVGAAMPVIGGLLCLVISTLTLSITLAIVVRDSAAGDSNMNQWPGFGPSEWFGSFAFVAFSLWVASLPGLILGNIGWAMTDRVDVMLILTSISMFLLGPISLISALYNDSIMNVFAPEILKSFSQDSASWTATYKLVGFTLGVFLLGTLILYIPVFIFSIIGAIIHAVAIIAFALIVGLQAGRIIGDIQRNA